jgi:hypothetical protein
LQPPNIELFGGFFRLYVEAHGAFARATGMKRITTGAGCGRRFVSLSPFGGQDNGHGKNAAGYGTMGSTAR